MGNTQNRKDKGKDSKKAQKDGPSEQQSRAQVRLTIEDVLDKGLPKVYSPQLYEDKCEAVYQHIYESYYGERKSVYA